MYLNCMVDEIIKIKKTIIENSFLPFAKTKKTY